MGDLVLPSNGEGIAKSALLWLIANYMKPAVGTPDTETYVALEQNDKL